MIYPENSKIRKTLDQLQVRYPYTCAFVKAIGLISIIAFGILY